MGFRYVKCTRLLWNFHDVRCKQTRFRQTTKKGQKQILKARIIYIFNLHLRLSFPWLCIELQEILFVPLRFHEWTSISSAIYFCPLLSFDLELAYLSTSTLSQFLPVLRRRSQYYKIEMFTVFVGHPPRHLPLFQTYAEAWLQ